MLNQIIKTLESSERERRREYEDLKLKALQAEEDAAVALAKKAEYAHGMANGIGLAVLFLKNKRYEMEEGIDGKHSKGNARLLHGRGHEDL